jgi:predicted Zn finger-like uncharacterized protein
VLPVVVEGQGLMRLICPNCDAQYEVDDAAIPVAGRDVQCSNCGHAWFQLPPEVEAEQAAEAALFDAPDPAADTPPVAVETDHTVIAPLADAPPLPPSASPPPMPPAASASPVQRQIDESVLAVLREEAEREMIARRLDAQALETQQELGIDAAIAATMASAGPQTAMPRATPTPEPDPDPAPVNEPKRELTRREMLPDIEEINSTLRPGDVAVSDDGEAFEIARRPEAGRSSFRSGFVLMLVLAVIGLAAYVMAPQISAQIPAAKPAMDGYVSFVDAGRTWLDETTRGLIASLRGVAGSDSP